jgi:hypothetical protein
MSGKAQLKQCINCNTLSVLKTMSYKKIGVKFMFVYNVFGIIIVERTSHKYEHYKKTLTLVYNYSDALTSIYL